MRCKASDTPQCAARHLLPHEGHMRHILYYFSESTEGQAQVIGSIQNGLEYILPA